MLFYWFITENEKASHEKSYENNKREKIFSLETGNFKLNKIKFELFS